MQIFRRWSIGKLLEVIMTLLIPKMRYVVTWSLLTNSFHAYFHGVVFNKTWIFQPIEAELESMMTCAKMN